MIGEKNPPSCFHSRGNTIKNKKRVEKRRRERRTHKPRRKETEATSKTESKRRFVGSAVWKRERREIEKKRKLLGTENGDIYYSNWNWTSHCRRKIIKRAKVSKKKTID